MPQPNIILTGFMGTGKTSIGREVAARLGRPFVDLDDLIVARAGKSIPAIFAEDGEAAFRALEAALCREMAAPSGIVLAVGGGAVVSEANRQALAAGGMLICLDAPPETILERVGQDANRPMLAAADRLARIRELLDRRAAAYAAIPIHLDTAHLSIAAAAERVMGIAAGLPEGGHQLIVNAGGQQADRGADHFAAADGRPSYAILIAPGILAQAGRRIVEAGIRPGRCAVVTNEVIGQHYGAALRHALTEAGFEPLLCEIPDGEAYKTLDTAATLYSRFAEARLARNEPVIALGGGVIGDLAGFVAATWLRGVPFVQIPTSLLAMVDASVGGKVAVDLPAGKNLVGAFKQPVVVLIDPDLLRTLPAAEFRSGLAEVLKAGIIGDPALFEQLATTGPTSLTAMIADAVRVKARIVERDPFEMAERAWLNLGHTFGHALELLSGYTLRHGEAVAVGTVAAAELSAALGYCDVALPDRIRTALAHLGLPTRHAFDPAAALAAMGTDKKRRGRALRFILIKRIGEVTIAEGIAAEDVLAALEKTSNVKCHEMPHDA
ncbi:MAG: 3-dehydroquinate synthase [Anaerolineae bacterium]|nr:3-dehydroquinate synthase [Anaerolineae bacterium]